MKTFSQGVFFFFLLLNNRFIFQLHRNLVSLPGLSYNVLSLETGTHVISAHCRGLVIKHTIP